MKKRLIALAGGAALVAAAAVPLGSAFAQPLPRKCQQFAMAIDALESQFSNIPPNSPRIAAFDARINQIEAANEAAGCPPIYVG